MNKKILIAVAIIIMLFSTAAFAQTSQSLTLKSGFNFVSFTTSLTLTPTQFKALNSSIEDVYLFSAAAGSFLNVKDGTLTSLAAGKGYIVKNSSGSDISVTIPGGVISAIGNITLKAGFNLVGFSKVPASITFKTIMETYTMIKGIYKWSPAAGGFIQVIRDNSGVPVLMDGADPTFKAGESYFFNLTSDTSINYDGTSIVVGATAVNPNAAPATIGGTLNSAAGMAELGISYQAAGEEFDVTLVDYDGNAIPSISLEAGETNPKVVKDGQAYSFKTKDFTKSYKVIAKGKTTANKMLSTFVGKVKENETVEQRDMNPIATAMSMIYADPNKDAVTYKQEEQTKKQDPTFMKKIAPVVADLETKRSSSLGSVDFSNPAKLEQAYKDAILGSSNPQEIAKIKDGLDAVIGKLEEQLSVLEKLKDALTLVATSGRRQNETYVKESKSKIKSLLTAEATDPLKDTTNKQVYKEAKISYGLVCCDLGDIFKNNVSSTTATGAPNMMAAYQAMDGVLDARAKAEYEEGYKAVKDLTYDEADKTKGLDESGMAAILKNASELAKEDSSKLDEAKKKADVLISEMENDGKFQINLPTGESLPKDKILEEKGDALINGGRPTEAVNVFEDIDEPRVKNFGLGRAYLQLNDLEFAYKNLKDSVKDIAKSSKGFESRMNLEAQFGKINEALFAFAAVLDKLKNGTEADVMQIKSKLQSEEQLEGSSEQILDDPNVTLSKLIKDIKPSTSFFEIGKKFADGQTGFGGQFVNVTQETDTLKKAFQNASKLMFKANQYIDKARNAATETERKKIMYEGKTAGTIDAPAADTAFKYLTDAEAAFNAIFVNTAVTGVMKGDAHYHLGLAFMAHYRGYKVLNIENKELLSKAKEVFLNIQSVIYDAEYAHLQFAITQMIKTMENFENEAAGVVVDNDSIYKTAEKLLERAESLYFDGQSTVATGEFDKAFIKFDESYKSTDTKITAKMKEAALYYSGYCLFYKFKLMSTPDDTVKVKVLERLKLFKLKFPKSEFLNAAADMINDITSNVSTLGPVDLTQAKPGPEFGKAVSIMEKLRLFYRNNYSTTEIETAFNQAKFIFETVAVQLTTDVKYIGTYSDPKFAAALKDFRAHAKFMLAILYMERFVMPVAKDVKYKNLALQYFNELVMNDYTQPFIPDVKNFIAQLKEEVNMEFAEGQPIFTDMFLNQHVFAIDAVKAGTAQLTMTVGVVIPDAAAGVTVSSVKAELKKFGNTVFDDAGAALKDLALTKVPSTVAVAPEKWELKLTLPKNLEIAPYDFKVVALTSASKSAEAYVPFVLEGQTTYARIKNVIVTPNGTNVFTVSVSHAPEAAFVATEGKYTDVYVSVMVPQYGYLMQSMDYSQDIKLTRVSATSLDFTLDLAKELPSLKQGSYVFLFKLINYNPADPVNSFSMPVDVRPFDFFVQSTVAGADNQIVLNAYNKILTNFNSADTPANKVAEFEKMFDSALSTEMKTSLTTAFSSVTNLKFTLVGTPFVQYTNNFNGENLVAVFAPWKLSGTYSKDVFNGVILPDGKMILPPGKTGSQIMDFMIDGNFEFAKRYSNGVETWLINMGGADNAAPVTTEKPTLTSFAGVAIPAAGGQVAVPSLTNMPFVKVAGQNLKSYEPDVKRVLRILGPNLNMPVILSDSGSYEWMSDSISFSSEKLKGLKGVYSLEMLDSKYGIMASVPLSFMDSGTVPAVSAILFQITSGQNSSQPFNLIRPFEVDRNSDLILKGDKLVPATGSYSLRYYNMTSAGTTTPTDMTSMFVSFAVSTGNANWTNSMITVKKEQLPTSAVITDGMPTSIVVWDDAKNMPASSQVPVVFLSQLIDPNAGAQAVINTVNGYDAKSTVMIDKKSTDTTGNIDVVGSGFMSVTSRHLDLVLQINGRPVHIPIAYSTPMMAAGTTSPTAANWSNTYIKGTINYNMPIPVMDPTMPSGEMLGTAVTKYPCGLVIWDDQLQKQVTPFMVAVKFMATTTTTPIITSVNGMPFNGTPIELYAEATEIKVEGQNFGEQSSMGTKGLYLRSQPNPMNPMPVTTFLAVMSWNSTMISATMPAAMQGGVYELFIGDMQTAATTGSTAYNPAGGVVNISKIVLVNLKSTTTPTTATAFINNINGTSAASTVTIAEGVKSLNITGKGFKSMYGTSRMLYMKLKGTNDWKYLADSYMATWTDTSITVNLMDQPVGAFEMFIAETDFGASIISNTVYVIFGQSTTGPNITSINGITITPGMMVTLKSDFTSLDIMGTNFGANTDNNLIVRFVPYPDPTNPNPAPFIFPTTSWTTAVVKVGRPTLTAGVTLMKGTLEMFNKALNRVVTMPVPVDFTSTTASTIPAVSGLKYDSTMKKLMWNPATSATSSMMYAYIVNVDGMIYEVPMGVYDFPVNTLMDGEHKAMVQAKIPNTYPAQVGPLSTAITFTTAGGSTNTIPKVVGLMYDSAMKSVRWTPVQTATPDGFMQYYVYMVEIDGAVIPNSISMAEYYVMNLVSGVHKIRVQAQMPGSFPPVAGPFSDPYTFTVEGGTGTAIPAVTGITYDAAMNKLKWNPVTATTAAMPFSYNINIDNASFFFGPIFMNEFIIPPMVPAGAHNVMVQAVMESAPPQMGAWSAPFSFTSTASTTGSLQAPVINYEPTTKMLSWSPVPSPDANSMVEYKILVNGIEKMMWAQTSLYLGNTMLGLDFTVNNVITVKAVVYYLNLESPMSNAVNTLGSGTTGGGVVAVGTYTGRFNGYSGPPTGTLTINVMAGGMFSVSGYNESKQQNFTSSGTVNANNEIVFDVTFLETLTYKGIANGSMLDGKFFLKTNPAAVIGSWNAMGSTTTTSDLMSINAMNGEIMANFTAAPMPAPTMADFVVKQSINGAPEANVMVTSIMPFGMSVKLMIPMIQPTNAAQIINVSVSYKGGPVKTATYNIPIGTTGGMSVTFDKQSGSYPNAMLEVYMTAAPATAFIWYTNDGTDPKTSATKITATIAGYPVKVMIPAGMANYKIMAVATDQAGIFSPVVEQIYNTTGSTSTSAMTFTSAANGTITLNISPAPAAVPVLGDFVVKMLMNGMTTEMPVSVMSIGAHLGQTAVVLSVMPEVAGTAEKRFVYKVSYKNGAFLSSPEVIVPVGGTVTVPAINPDSIIFDPGTSAMPGKKVAWQTPNGITKPFFVTSCTVTNNLGGMTQNNMIPMGTSYMEIPTGGSWDTATSINVTLKIIAADTDADLHSSDPTKVVTSETVKNNIPYSSGGTTTTYTVSNVQASNGSVSFTITPAPTVTPAYADFIVNVSNNTVNSGAFTPVTGFTLNGGMAAITLTVPQIQPGAATQLIKYQVSFKGSQPVNSNEFTVTGGGTVTIPNVPGVTYDEATKKIKWQAISMTNLPAGSNVMYDIRIDGTTLYYPAVSMYEFDVTMASPPITSAVNHTYEVRARLTYPTQQDGSWTSGNPTSFTYTAGGGTAGIPTVTGLVQDTTNTNKLTWTGLTPASTYYYDVKIDDNINQTYGYMPEYWIPMYNINPGNHTVSVRGRDQAGVTGNWSTTINIFVPVPPVTGIWFENSTKLLKWGSAAGTGPTYEYNIKIDNGTPVSVGTAKEYSVANLTVGIHTVQVQARYTSVTPVLEGPWYDPMNTAMQEFQFEIMPAAPKLTGSR